MTKLTSYSSFLDSNGVISGKIFYLKTMQIKVDIIDRAVNCISWNQMQCIAKYTVEASFMRTLSMRP